MSEQIKPVATYEEWFLSQQGHCFDGMWSFAKAAWEHCENLNSETVQQFQEQIRLLENDKVRLIAWREQSDYARNNAYAQNQRLRDQVQQLQQRNDRLLAALKDARDWIDKNNFGGCDTFALLEKIDAIIAEGRKKV